MRKFKKMMCALLAVSMITPQLPAMTAQAAEGTNLAQKKEATCSAEYSTMPASYALDGDLSTRWSTEKGVEGWLAVDLEASSVITGFKVAAENVAAQKIGQFKIEGSDDGSTYEEIYQSEDLSTSGGFDLEYDITLENAVEYKYVKITIQKLVTGAYNSVSLREFQVYGTVAEGEQDPKVNVAQGKTAVASSIEADSVKASNAVDGDSKSSTSRWGSNRGDAPHWIYVDLGETMNVKTVRIFWENRKATAYKIQVATELSETMVDADWTTVKEFTDRPVSTTDVITLDTKVQARYVRLYIDAFTAADPDSTGVWNTVSIYEMEVFGGVPVASETIDTVSAGIEVTTPQKGDQTLEVTLPESSMYEVTYNGTDYEQVVGSELEIYEPIVDTKVSVSFKIENKADASDYGFVEKEVVIPGKYAVEEGDNVAPEILPELREWKGYTGSFVPTTDSRIVIASEDLKEVAAEFQADYKEIVGKDIEVVVGTTANAGDFYFALTEDTTKGLQDEGYFMEIQDKVTVEAETTTGAYWATRTILQSLKMTGDIPNGLTRDYPLYEVRGYILDVGRKTFTIDYLEQIVKQMAWYKMNDFQVHLNDNLIFLEQYTAKGWDPMTAYSGFRLESDIKAGETTTLNGKEFTYSADLTNTDVYYTKEEFRNLIQKARVCGVDIVPEIDTPAHSLALTKVLPELRTGTSGRQNDHLDLANQYNECLEFVQSIFGEYMEDENPVFDEDTIIHIGADEYEADGNAYRQFVNDMFEYADTKGRKARVWGSLSQIKGTVTDGESKVYVDGTGHQMNLWNAGWANMAEMYELGFELINCNDGNYYSVPNAGYYGDYLGGYNSYSRPINTIGNTTIPAGDPQMVGGAFALWNDMIDIFDNGISEYDAYKRVEEAFALMGAKLWGTDEDSKTLKEAQALSQELGEAPNTNFGYEVEADEDGNVVHYTMTELGDLKASGNATIQSVDGKNVLSLGDATSYVTTEYDTIGLETMLTVNVKRMSDSTDEQILFESSYGAIKAVQADTGKVGFSRENMDYSFDYTLPVGEWVELQFYNRYEDMYLYVNDELVDIVGDDETVANNSGNARPLLATMMIPFERIGSTTNGFVGYVSEVDVKKVVTIDDSVTRISTDNFTVTSDNEFGGTGSEGPIALAFDGDTSTIWHSNYSPYQALPATVTIDMNQSYVIDQFDYLPRQDGSVNGIITSYQLYGKLNESDEYVLLSEGEWLKSDEMKTASLEPVEVRYLKFVAVTGATNSSNQFASAAEFYVHEYVDRTELSAACVEAEAYTDGSKYTETSWEVFVAAREAALKVLNRTVVTKEDVAAAVSTLKAAQAGLTEKQEEQKECTSHTYKSDVTPATTKAAGSIVKTCSTCGHKVTSKIAKIKSVTLSKSSYTYNGKAQKPSVTVKDENGKTINSSNYSVSYAKGRKSVGKYKVSITFKGNYSGKVTKTFVINPKTTSLTKVKAAKKAISLKWSKKTTQVTGYQIQYCTSKKFKSGVKNAWVKSAKTTSKTIKSLKAKKTYYVRIRTYKTVDKVKYYSAWSTVKKVKTK